VVIAWKTELPRADADQPVSGSAAATWLVSAAAHEIRAPVHAMGMLLELLIDEADAMPAPRRMALLERLRQNTSWLSCLLDSLLPGAGTGCARADGATDALDALRAATSCVEPLMEARRQVLRAVVPPGPVLVRMDRVALGQVLVNLLQNASKYSVRDDEIEVRVEQLGPTARITVRDHGAGVPAADLEHIFARYARGSRADGPVDGRGLGLAIARELVERHAGTLTVASAPGRGAAFALTVPAARARRSSLRPRRRAGG
jgi:signal transduction histidine kinase